jgi:hypothetical protein
VQLGAVVSTFKLTACCAFLHAEHAGECPRADIFRLDNINPDLQVTAIPSTLNPQPSTLNPQPSTINHQPSTLDHQPSTLDPRPSTLYPRPSTLNL